MADLDKVLQLNVIFNQLIEGTKKAIENINRFFHTYQRVMGFEQITKKQTPFERSLVRMHNERLLVMQRMDPEEI